MFLTIVNTSRIEILVFESRKSFINYVLHFIRATKHQVNYMKI